MDLVIPRSTNLSLEEGLYSSGGGAVAEGRRQGQFLYVELFLAPSRTLLEIRSYFVLCTHKLFGQEFEEGERGLHNLSACYGIQLLRSLLQLLKCSFAAPCTPRYPPVALRTSISRPDEHSRGF